jgi:hypothetical protein
MWRYSFIVTSTCSFVVYLNWFLSESFWGNRSLVYSVYTILYKTEKSGVLILWHVDSLVGNDREISNYTIASTVGVGVLLAADSQSTSASGYRASLWDPWPDFYLALLTSSDNYFFLFSKAPSLMRKRVCSLQCNHSLVRAVTPSNRTLPSHLRLCSLFVASYDSQGLRWKYSNPPPHGVQ